MSWNRQNCHRSAARLQGVAILAVVFVIHAIAVARADEPSTGAAPAAQPSAQVQQLAPATPQLAPASPAQPSQSAPVTPSATTPAPAAQAGTPAVVVDGKQLESILGKKVLSAGGDDMGRIVDILANKSGQLRAAIIDFGGFLGVGNRQIAVDWKAIRFPKEKSDAVVVELSRDQLRTAPVYKAGEQIVVLGTPPAPDTQSSAQQPGQETASSVARGAPSN